MTTEQPRSDRPLKVLAAEDNLTNQMVVTGFMGVFGMALTLVEDGAQVLEAWRGGEFDVILMDIQMPVMDGLTAARTIRAEERQTGRARIPIVALTAHAMPHQVADYLAGGIDLHVPKPVEMTRLKAVLEQAAALRAAA
jgi:CheY-like chemotaxis protein